MTVSEKEHISGEIILHELEVVDSNIGVRDQTHLLLINTIKLNFEINLLTLDWLIYLV